MAEAEDGRWAADTTGRAESRQNGKGDEIEVVELWGLTQRSEAILHTAHEAATAASAHERLIGLVEGHRDLRVKVRKKQSWNGNYSLHMSNDGLIVWRTRTGAGGRGLDDISRIVIDEAQHAQPEELASSLPILSVNPNPQKNFIGSGGVAGKSSFWWRQRRRALAATPGRFAWLEHSAEIVTVDTAGRLVTSVGDVADPETWRRANPAYPSRISHDFLLDQLETLGPALFAREHLCVWDPEPDGAGSAFDMLLWDALADARAERGAGPVFGVATAPDRTWSAIAAAWHRPDGQAQVMLADYQAGASWVTGRAEELSLRWGGSFTTNTAARGLITGAAELSEQAQAQAHNLLSDRIADGTVRHYAEPPLNVAVAQSRWRTYGNTRVLDRRGQADITPAEAVALALHALGEQPPADFFTI